MLTEDDTKETDQPESLPTEPQDLIPSNPSITDYLNLSKLTSAFEVWPTSNKLFELDLKNIAGHDLLVSMKPSQQEGLKFKFAGDRKAVFEPSFSSVLDAEGKNKVFVQITTPQSRSEITLHATFEISLPELGLSCTVPIIVRVR